MLHDPRDPVEKRADGLANAITGLGDPTKDTRLQVQRKAYGPQSGPMSAHEACLEYAQSWTAAREIDQLAGDMFREGFVLRVDEEDFPTAETMAIVSGSLKAGVQESGAELGRGLLSFAHALRVAGDKVGGAVMLAILDDGLDPVEPLDLDRINSVEGWEVLDRQEVSPWARTANTQPEFFIIGDVVGDLRPGQVIHRSRLWIHPGRELSRREMRSRNWWGASKLELLRRERRGAEEADEYSRSFMQRASYDHLQFAELNEMLGATDEDGTPIGETLVKRRLAVMQSAMTVLGMAITDGGRAATDQRGGVGRGARPADKLESVARDVGSLPELNDQQLERWRMGSAMPRSIAFGETPSGMNSGDNAGDWQAWSGVVRTEQKMWATPGLSWMLTLIWAAKDGPSGGQIPEAYEIEWIPLVVPSIGELATVDKDIAMADAIRVQNGLATPSELRQLRYVDGDATGNLMLDEADFGDVAGRGEMDPDLDQPDAGQALAGAAALGVSDVQAQALNGAQVRSLFDLVAAVANGEIPEATALWLVTTAVPGIDEAQARAALSTAGSFTPAAPVPPLGASVTDAIDGWREATSSRLSGPEAISTWIAAWSD